MIKTTTQQFSFTPEEVTAILLAHLIDSLEIDEEAINRETDLWEDNGIFVVVVTDD